MVDAALPNDVLDVLIVGAGISGIDAACRFRELLPDVSIAVLERRERVGGTWDLFRYPGIRSDSDIFTLSFPFRPWRGERSLVDGDEIRDYLVDTVRERGVDRYIEFSTEVLGASWSSADQVWTVRTVVGPDRVERTRTARFVYFCSGYYSYAEPYTPDFPGVDDFAGTLVHPQHWPEDLDLAGKRVVVIGSGATAISLAPGAANAGAAVTILQRTPSYIFSVGRVDAVANVLRRVLPPATAHRVIRNKNIVRLWGLYAMARHFPAPTKQLIRRRATRLLGNQVVDDHFTPPYNPWDQRVCAIPDNDLYEDIREGRIAMVTDRIESFVPEGIRLASGRVLPADVVVTATGLTLQMLGGARLTVDGVPIDPGRTVIYQGALLSGVPNLAICVGYINSSWTLRADATARFVCRLVERMRRTGAGSVTPTLDGEVPADAPPMFGLAAGYIARSGHLLPRSTGAYPWTMTHNPLVDVRQADRSDLTEGLHYEPLRSVTPADPVESPSVAAPRS
ncbi:flavin-containing monooxygenase [Millisia brevis]|uniref:flavin-containing monooxygenase n=1 Tax=Millisia brevis TaxID=264148 RepID=UPI00082B17FF|nr:NAD(P)/FAD-dependent oxidoreductase [Millisia brevis]